MQLICRVAFIFTLCPVNKVIFLWLSLCFSLSASTLASPDLSWTKPKKKRWTRRTPVKNKSLSFSIQVFCKRDEKQMLSSLWIMECQMQCWYRCVCFGDSISKELIDDLKKNVYISAKKYFTFHKRNVDWRCSVIRKNILLCCGLCYLLMFV